VIDDVLADLGIDVLYSPFVWPRLSRARLAITSLAFMLVEVPAPPGMKSVTTQVVIGERTRRSWVEEGITSRA
jgi:hypothetical protein